MTKITQICLIFILAGSGLFPGLSFALQTGVAVQEIEIPAGVKMWGYKSRTQPWSGKWDPLMMKAMVFADGTSQAALVVLDLGRTPVDSELERIKTQVKQQHGVDYCLVVATHTHAGPRLGTLNDPAEWEKQMSREIIDLVGKAAAQKTVSTLRVAKGEVDISYDRRFVKEDGTVEMIWQNHERKPLGPVDKSVRVVFVADRNNQPIVTLVHYACHPVLGSNKNLKLSADFPASLCDYVEDTIGGTCVYLQGACGDLNPYLAAVLKSDEGYEQVIQEGQAVGREVVRIHEQAKAVQDDLKIKYVEKKSRVGLKKKKDEDFHGLLKWMYGPDFIRGVKKGEIDSIRLEIPILMLGDSLAWAGFPGEFFDTFQVELANRSPVPHTYFLGYCNGYYSYFPTIHEAAQGGYGADYGLIAEVGAGERLIDLSIIGLYELLGEL